LSPNLIERRACLRVRSTKTRFSTTSLTDALFEKLSGRRRGKESRPEVAACYFGTTELWGLDNVRRAARSNPMTTSLQSSRYETRRYASDGRCSRSSAYSSSSASAVSASRSSRLSRAASLARARSTRWTARLAISFGSTGSGLCFVPSSESAQTQGGSSLSTKLVKISLGIAAMRSATLRWRSENTRLAGNIVPRQNFRDPAASMFWFATLTELFCSLCAEPPNRYYGILLGGEL
jgi:hypothetical protein